MTNFNFLLNKLSYLSSEELVDRRMDSTCFRSAPVPPSFRLRLHPLRMVATLLLILCLGVGNVWGADATITGIENSTSVTVNSKSGLKCATGKKSGSMKITVPSGATSISFYISGWGSDGTTVSVTPTANVNTTSVTPEVDACFTGNGTTFSTDEDESTYACTITLKSITASTDITFSSGTGKRFIIWGATYSTGGGCDKTVTLSYDGDAASHGEFVLKAGSASGSTISEGGTTDNCGSGTTTVALCPKNVDAHYHLEASNITATNKTGSITSDGNGNFLISYTQGSNVSSSVSVTFTEDTKYTVTWSNNGSTYTTTQVYDGEYPVLPANPSSCDATSDTFYGWSTTAWTGALDDVSAKTIYTDASAMPAVTGAVTYYAVFAKAVKSDNFQLLTSSSNFISGEDYLIESYFSSTDHVLKAANYSGYSYQQTSENSWTLPSGGVNFDMSGKSALCIWKITSEGNNRFSIYNASANKYLVLVTVSTYDNLILSATKDASFIRTVVKEEGYSDAFKFESSAVSGKHLYCEGAYWDAYTSAEEVYLYKRVTTYSKYRTNCCTNLASINGSFF